LLRDCAGTIAPIITTFPASPTLDGAARYPKDLSRLFQAGTTAHRVLDQKQDLLPN